MITITFTDEQYDIFTKLWNTAKQQDLAISEAFGAYTTDDVEEKYQLPSDDILEDMADAEFQVRTGVPMF